MGTMRPNKYDVSTEAPLLFYTHNTYHLIPPGKKNKNPSKLLTHIMHTHDYTHAFSATHSYKNFSLELPDDKKIENTIIPSAMVYEIQLYTISHIEVNMSRSKTEWRSGVFFL